MFVSMDYCNTAMPPNQMIGVCFWRHSFKLVKYYNNSSHKNGSSHFRSKNPLFVLICVGKRHSELIGDSRLCEMNLTNDRDRTSTRLASVTACVSAWVFLLVCVLLVCVGECTIAIETFWRWQPRESAERSDDCEELF